MANPATIAFGRRFANLFVPPILEVGAKIQPAYQQLSPHEMHSAPIGTSEWLGIDIEEGNAVDMVLDLSTEGAIDVLGRERFNTVYCLSVLAHVPDVSTMARSIEAVLRPGGWLYVAVPFAWKLHRIPYDMWRFTPQSIDYLFPHVRFDPGHCALATRDATQFLEIGTWPELPLGTGLDKLPFPLRFSIKVLRKLKWDEGYFSHRALLVESLLLMIGQKQAEPAYSFFQKK